ncbi:MAG: (2Fe-2S)-binding protein [Dehalococcoidia bacterium]|nr:(2Fe-2S)-binding protein [Dehalococcoidia bacterium]
MPINHQNGTIPMELTVNGRAVSLEIPPQMTLLDLLRDRLSLKGVKRSCDLQVCGACTILVDGHAVSSCTYLAYEARGADVLTIEGLADGNTLHPMQQAFIDNGAFQCGFCTPGMILAAKSLLDETPRPSEEKVKEYMEGNICRCTGYRKILEAILDAAGKSGGASG